MRILLGILVFILLIVATPFSLNQFRYISWKTYNTVCGFSFKYPSSWSVKKITDNWDNNSSTNQVCSFDILAPNVKNYNGMGEKGTIIGIDKNPKGNHLYNPGPNPNQEIYYVFNTEDDVMKFYIDMRDSWTNKIAKDLPIVTDPQKKILGNLSGKFIIISNNTNDYKSTIEHFSAIKGNYLYDLSINWHDSFKEDRPKYSDIINSIFSSISFH